MQQNIYIGAEHWRGGGGARTPCNFLEGLKKTSLINILGEVVHLNFVMEKKMRRAEFTVSLMSLLSTFS